MGYKGYTKLQRGAFRAIRTRKIQDEIERLRKKMNGMELSNVDLPDEYYKIQAEVIALQIELNKLRSETK